MKSLHSFLTIALIVLSIPCMACMPEMTIDIISPTSPPNPKVGQNVVFQAVCDSSPIEEYVWTLPPEAYSISGLGTDEITCKFFPAGQYTVTLDYKYSGSWYSVTTENPVQVDYTNLPWYVSLDGDDNNAGHDLTGPDHWANAFRNIQTAIDSAYSGNEIIVHSGTSTDPAVYYEQLDMKGKSLKIYSEDPAYQYTTEWELTQNTVINAQKQGSAIIFQGNENAAIGASVEGFTITGGYPAGDGLAMHLELDETPGSTAADSSGKQRAGTLVNGPTWATTGHTGWALSFDGIDDYVEIEDYKGIVGQDSRTCAAWVKTTKVNGVILSWGNHDYSGKWIVRVNYDGRLRAEVQGGYIIGTTLINDDQWHHVAVVLENDGSPDISEAQLYVDGQLETISAYADQPANTVRQQNIVIGACILDTYTYFEGLIDDVCVYSGALTAGEIRGVANQLVAHWKLDNSCDDATGNGHNGVPSNPDPEYSVGMVGASITLDGTEDITVPHHSQLKPELPLTMAAWVYLESSGTEGVILRTDDGGTDPGNPVYSGAYMRMKYGGTDTIALGYGDGSSTSSQALRIKTGTTVLQPGQWYHVAGVIRGSDDMSIYINGVDDGGQYSGSGSGVLHYTDHDIAIGSRCGIDSFFQGQLDDIRLYSGALTTEEIQGLAKQLVAHWKLDNSCEDATGNGHDGVPGNPDPEYNEGMVGSSITLDGTEDIAIPDHSQLKPELPLTMAAWVYLESSGTNGVILQTDDWGTDAGSPVYSGAYMRLKYDGSGTIALGYGDGNSTSWTALSNKIGTTVLQSGQWYHVVGVIRGSDDMSIYINGVEDGGEYGGSGSGVLHYTDHDVTIGSCCGIDSFFQGQLDDVRLYNYGLSETEVESLYRTRFADGGGIKGHGAFVNISKCIVKENVSEADGGGISDIEGMIQNCLIVDNESLANGGGLAGCDDILENNTIVNNHANNVGGLVDCRGDIRNLIVWGNTDNAAWAQTSNIVMPTYSCIQDYQPDDFGNINYTPYFSDTDFHLYDYSPCVDAGDDTSVCSNEPLCTGVSCRIDMGAYGNTDGAECIPADSDSDDDGMPDSWESAMFFGTTDYGPDVDTDGDGVLNIDEYYAGTNPSDEEDFAIPLWWYVQYQINPQTPMVMDDDNDYVSNIDEFIHGTNPHADDSDGDGVPDRWEIDFVDYIELDPAVYDAYTTSVGGIPGIWWYTWWIESNEAAEFIPSQTNADLDFDSDGFINLVEYQNGTNPLNEDNSSDYGTETVYDDAGNAQTEKEFVYTLGTPTPECLSETVHEFDNLGRQWRTRQKYSPEGSDDPANDSITLTQYNVDGSVYKTIRKGYTTGGVANLYDDAEETGDVVVAYTYDAFGRQYQVTDALGDTTYHYSTSTGLLDWVDLPTRAGDPTRIITYQYDEIGRVEATVNPEGNYEVKTYDSMNRVTKSMLYKTNGGAIDDPYGSVDDVAVTQRRMEYDNLGTLAKNIVMANAASTSTTVDPDTDRVTENQIAYDSINKEVNTITYSGLNTVVDGTWSYTDVANDASGRGLPTEIWKGEVPEDDTQPMVKQYIVYNASGQVTVKIVDHFDHFVDRESADTPDVSTMTKTEYDSYGRMTASVADPDGVTSTTNGDLRTEFTYWGSRKLTQVDPKQNVTRFEYDAFGHMKTKTEDADGLARVTKYEYDRLGNLVKLTADDDNTDNDPTPTVQETVYTYDLASNVTKITYPDTDSNPNNDSIFYVYDDPAAGGRPTQRTDQNAITTKYTYDEMGNLLQKQNDPDSPTIVETYTYDARGLMLTAKKGSSLSTLDDISVTTFNNYDGLGNVDDVTQKIRTGSARTIGYEHNQIGKVTEVTYPDASATQIAYSYTSLGQIDEVYRDPSGTNQELADYDYAGSLVKERFYDLTTYDVTLNVDYDEFGRIKRYKTLNSSGVGVDFEYTYDDNGNITDKKFNHRSSTPNTDYAYDDLNRLIQADYLGATGQTFNYDLLGNRNSVVDARPGGGTDTYGDNTAVNEYEMINSATQNVFHDAAGNLTTDHRGYGYIYDYENRLIQVYFDEDSSGDYNTGDRNIAEFEYDALGRRIEKVDATAQTTTRYYYDDQRVLLETDYNTSTSVEADVRYYVYGNYIDEVLVMHRFLPTEVDYYYAHDHLYSPVAVYGPAGLVLERYEYDAYGDVKMMTSLYVERSSSLMSNPTTFTGRRADVLDGGDLKLMYYRARTYDPQTGRMMQKDPLGIDPAGGERNPFRPTWQHEDGMNIYEYTQDNPVNKIDPQGLFLIDPKIDPIIIKPLKCIEDWINKPPKKETCEWRTESYTWQHLSDWGYRDDVLKIPGVRADGKDGCISIPARIYAPLESREYWDAYVPKGCVCTYVKIFKRQQYCCGKKKGKPEFKKKCCTEDSQGTLVKTKRWGWDGWGRFPKYDYSCKCDTLPDGSPVSPPEMGPKIY